MAKSTQQNRIVCMMKNYEEVKRTGILLIFYLNVTLYEILDWQLNDCGFCHCGNGKINPTE